MPKKLGKKKYLNRLDSKITHIRKQAIQHFAFNPDPCCLPRIRDILRYARGEKIIRWASYALAQNHDQTSTALIARKIEEIDNPRSEAVEWLKISQEILSEHHGVDHILDLLDSRCVDDIKDGLLLSFAHKHKSEGLIKSIADNSFTSSSDVRRWTNLTLGNTDGFRNADIIIPFLSDPEFIVREWAAWALASMKVPESESVLREQIHDVHPRVREWIAKALSGFDSVATTYFLLNHYYCENDSLCKEGIIRSLNPTRASTQDFLQRELENHIDDGAIVLVLAILDKLSECKASGLVFETVARLLLQTDRTDIREAAVVVALANIGSEELPVMKRMLTDPRFRIIGECLKEAQSLLPTDESGRLELYDSQGNPVDSGKLEEVSRKATCLQMPDRDDLSIKYNRVPVAVLNGEQIRGFSGSPLSFAMLLNLAARRKANYPEKGLAHKAIDLLDDSQGEKNFGNLKVILAHQKCAHILKANCDEAGGLMRDRRVYLDIETENISIDESIVEYKSTHRNAVRKLLEDQDKKWPLDEEKERYYKRLERTSFHLSRCESLVDDAIERLRFEKRPEASLSEVRKLLQEADEVMRRRRESS